MKILKTTTLMSGLVGLCAGMAAFQSPALAAKYKSASFGSWKGSIHSNNETGKFSHCVATARYKSGITLLFSVNAGLRWKVGFSKPNWTLTPGDDYRVLYQVDKRKVQKGEARARTEKLAVINLPGSNALFEQMRRGRVLRVKAGEDILAFNLTGTSRMLSALLNCAKEYDGRRLAQPPVAKAPARKESSNPFASTKPRETVREEDSAAADPNFRREAAGWFRTYLASDKATYSVIPNEGKAQKMYKRHALVWRVGKGTGIIGTLRVFPASKPGKMENQVLAHEARNCKGDFASKFFNNDGVGSSPATRLLTTCKQNNGKFWNAYYSIMPRERGGTHLMMVLSSRAAAADVADAGERIAGTVQAGGSSEVSNAPAEDDDLPVREEGDLVKF